MKNTPHINLLSDIGFSKTVLMPGDPLRSKMIANKYFSNAVLVNDIRGVQGYTGYYKGTKVSVMASGMGIASMGIYAYELYNFFGVQNIIRIGTAGGLRSDIKLKDIVAAIGANTDSSFANQFNVKGTIAPTCSYELLCQANKCAKEMGINLKTGNFYTSDTFYNADKENSKKWADVGSMVVEMETAGLYLTAMTSGKNALSLCTVSDLPLSEKKTEYSAEERQNTFFKMIELALETAIQLENNGGYNE